MDPATFQPVNDPNARTPSAEPLPDFPATSFPLEMDMSTAMSGALRHASREPARYGVGPSSRGIHDDEATSYFNQATVDAI